jgi:hypothetical protein
MQYMSVNLTIAGIKKTATRDTLIQAWKAANQAGARLPPVSSPRPPRVLLRRRAAGGSRRAPPPPPRRRLRSRPPCLAAMLAGVTAVPYSFVGLPTGLVVGGEPQTALVW